jgi:5-methylcytosine-specific restriction endonuclease McrA
MYPELARARRNRWRARQRQAPVNDLTAAQWREIKAAYNFQCAFCGKTSQRLTQDHLTSLSKGGSHTVMNVVPACQSRNSRKSAGPVLVPVQPLLLTVS